jgi:hypothetical protein
MSAKSAGWHGVGQNPVDRRPPAPPPERACKSCGSTGGPWATALLCSDCGNAGILTADLLKPR